MIFLSCIEDYTEDMVTLTTLVKNFPVDISEMQEQLGLAKILFSEKFSPILQFWCTCYSLFYAYICIYTRKMSV